MICIPNHLMHLLICNFWRPSASIVRINISIVQYIYCLHATLPNLQFSYMYHVFKALPKTLLPCKLLSKNITVQLYTWTYFYEHTFKETWFPLLFHPPPMNTRKKNSTTAFMIHQFITALSCRMITE